MNRTPYLEILLLLALSCPSAFIGLAAQRHYQRYKQRSWSWSWLLLLELLLLFLSLLLFPLDWHWNPAAQKDWLLLPLALLFTLGGEMLFLFGLQKNRFWAGYSKEHGDLTFFFLLALALCEELLYRSLLPHILQRSFSLSLLFALLISNCFFALIHCYQGAKTLLIKFFSGLVYAVLFLLSKDIMLSIAAHMLHNALVVLLRQMQKSNN